MKTYEVLEGYNGTIRVTETKEVIDIKRISVNKLKADFKTAKAKVNEAIDGYNSCIDLAQEIIDNTDIEIPNLPNKLTNV